jgi:hypothetical protein
MKNASGFDVVDSINLIGMIRKPVDCFYLGSELIKNKKISNGQAMRHTFAALQDTSTKFGCWGFGLLDSLLCGNEEKNRKAMAPNTPVRIIYKGKRAVEINGNDFNTHDVAVYDITEEVESKKITSTKLEELIWS